MIAYVLSSAVFAQLNIGVSDGTDTADTRPLSTIFAIGVFLVTAP